MLVDLPALAAPLPTVRVVAPYRSAPPFQRGGRRVLLLRAAPTSAVRAPCAGRVQFTGTVGGRAPVVTIGCLGTGARVTVSRLAPTQARGSTVVAGAVLGSARGTVVGLSLRRADGHYVDPLPLLRRARPAVPPAAVPRLQPPRVRLDRSVRVLHPSTAHAPVSSPPPADRWLGVIGSALGLGAGGAWLWAARRRRTPRARRAAHPVASRR